MSMWTKEQLYQMLGRKPKYVIKDEGGWYLRRKRLRVDNSWLLWTHNLAEARHMTDAVNAYLLRDHLNVEWDRSTITVQEVY